MTYDYNAGRITTREQIAMGTEVYYSSGRSYGKPIKATVLRSTKTTVTLSLVSGREIVFGIREGYLDSIYLTTERKSKSNEFPESYSSVMTVEHGDKVIARQEAEKVMQSAHTDVKNAMKVAEYNAFSPETLAEVKRVIGVLEDLRAEQA